MRYWTVRLEHTTHGSHRARMYDNPFWNQLARLSNDEVGFGQKLEFEILHTKAKETAQESLIKRVISNIPVIEKKSLVTLKVSQSFLRRI